MENIFYVVRNKEGKFYKSDVEWIPEGDKLFIYEVDNIYYADKFSSIKEIEDFKIAIENSRELYKGNYTIATGEFEVYEILKVRETLEVI